MPFTLSLEVRENEVKSGTINFLMNNSNLTLKITANKGKSVSSNMKAIEIFYILDQI